LSPLALTGVLQEGKDIVDHIANERERAHDETQSELKKTFEYQAQLVQFLAATIQTMIYLGQMVAPDLSIVFVCFRQYKKYLAAQGITMGPRDMIRLWRFAQSLAIMAAIELVFFLNVPGWEQDRPFSYADVLECQNFMFATEQIAAFTFTLLGGMFVHPQMDMIVRSIAKNNCNYTCLDGKAVPVGGKDIAWYTSESGRNTDFNYLSPPIAVGKELSVLQAAAHTIDRKFRGDASVVSRQMVEDVLHGLQGQTMLVRPYQNADDEDPSQEERSVPVIDTTDWPRNFRISRHFVDRCFKRYSDDENVLVDAVKSAFHRHTPRQRLVLGLAMRDKEKFHPYLLRVVEAAPADNKLLTVRNPKAVDFATGLLSQLKKDAPEADNLTVDCDLEDYHFRRFAQRLGVPEDQWARALPSALRRVQGGDPAHANRYPEALALQDEERQKSEAVYELSKFVERQDNKRVRKTI